MGTCEKPYEKNLRTGRRKKYRCARRRRRDRVQDPVDVLCIQMMAEYNKEKVTVYKTVQLYRHYQPSSFLKDMLEAAVLKNFVLGVKLVRGAYMEKAGAG